MVGSALPGKEGKGPCHGDTSVYWSSRENEDEDKKKYITNRAEALRTSGDSCIEKKLVSEVNIE